MRRLVLICIALCILFTGCTASVKAESEAQARAKKFVEARSRESLACCTKSDGTPFVIGVVDLDPYYASGEMLFTLVKRLQEQGWINRDVNLSFKPDRVYVCELAEYLADQNLGRFIRFSDKVNYYVAEDDEQECRSELNNAIENGELDMIISFGTIPARFAEECADGRIPVMACYCADPLGAGLVDGSQYSGRENVWAHIHKGLYVNQLLYMHSFIGFKNIGMIYYDEGVAAAASYRMAAQQRGFTVSERKIGRFDEAESSRLYLDEYMTALDDLIKNDNIDALMLNSDMLIDEESIRTVCNYLYDKKIKVLAQGADEVLMRAGVCMSTFTDNFEGDAAFMADALAEVFNGTAPQHIPQEYAGATFGVINMTSAKRLGIEITPDMLSSIGKVYY